MSKTYRQTLSDELAAKVETKRHELGLSVQELTTMALALYCQQQPCPEKRAAPPSPPADQPYELTW